MQLLGKCETLQKVNYVMVVQLKYLYRRVREYGGVMGSYVGRQAGRYCVEAGPAIHVLVWT